MWNCFQPGKGPSKGLVRAFFVIRGLWNCRGPSFEAPQCFEEIKLPINWVPGHWTHGPSKLSTQLLLHHSANGKWYFYVNPQNINEHNFNCNNSHENGVDARNVKVMSFIFCDGHRIFVSRIWWLSSLALLHQDLFDTLPLQLAIFTKMQKTGPNMQCTVWFDGTTSDSKANQYIQHQRIFVGHSLLRQTKLGKALWH